MTAAEEQTPAPAAADEVPCGCGGKTPGLDRALGILGIVLGVFVIIVGVDRVFGGAVSRAIGLPDDHA